MNRIFIGFLLIFLDFSITLGSSKIGLLPDFAGYIVMLGGLREMSGESPLFEKARPFAAVMAVYTGVLYFLDLAGVSASLGALSYILGILSVILSLTISYNIVMGVREMEESYSAPLNGDSLKSTWTVLAVFNILAFISILLPMLAIVCVIVSFIVGICFLVAFSRSKNMYYDLRGR